MSQEPNNAGPESVSGVGNAGAASTAPGDIANNAAASDNGGGESPAARRRLATPRAAGRAMEDAQPEATKKFVAPHRMEKETFRTHVGGLVAVSLWRTSSWIVGHLPAGLTYRVGGWASVVGYYAASPLRRRWLRANFGHVLGVPPSDKAAGHLARAAYRNYSRYIMELMRLPWMKPAQVEGLLEVRSLDRFIEIYKESNGIVLVAAHLGNNEAAAAGFAKHGLEINVVGDDSSYRELYELFSRQRESWGVKMIPWRNLRGVFGALRRHEGLVLLVDWGYREDGIPVRMFGSWTTLPAGPALLACKHGSSIVPFSINRQPDGTFRAAADDPILVASDSPADIAIATQKIADALENQISPAPEQWYNFKPIWPATAEEAARLEARHVAAMANDAKGAAPNGHGSSVGANGGRAAAGGDPAPNPAPTQPAVK